MAPLGIGVAVDLHIVRRIEERRIDRLAFADDRTQEVEIPSVAAADAVLVELPDVPDACAQLGRDCRNHLVIGINLLTQHDIDLTPAEPGQPKVHVELGQRQFGELELEDLDIPAGIQGDLVVREPQRLLLRFAQTDKLDHRDFGEPELLGREQPPVTCD